MAESQITLLLEPIFDNDLQTYIFDDEIISEKLTNYYIRKTVNNDLKSSDFKTEIEKKIIEIMKSNKLSETVYSLFWQKNMSNKPLNLLI